METKIVEFERERYDEVKDLIYLVLKHVGLEPQKYPELVKDIELENIIKTYKDRARFWLALLDNKVIGTVAVEEKDTETAKLKRMFVLPEYHGKGVGQQLMDTAMQFAQTNGYKKIILNTDKVMHRAHRFYERNGFRRTGEDESRLFYEQSIG